MARSREKWRDLILKSNVVIKQQISFFKICQIVRGSKHLKLGHVTQICKASQYVLSGVIAKVIVQFSVFDLSPLHHV